MRQTIQGFAKAPASGVVALAQEASILEARVRLLCDSDSTGEDVGRISRYLLKRVPHRFEFVWDARIP